MENEKINPGEIPENYVKTYKDEDGKEIRVIYIERDNIIKPDTVSKILEEFINNEFKKYVVSTLDATTKNVNTLITDFQNKLEAHTEEHLQEALVKILSENNSGEFTDRFETILEKIAREQYDTKNKSFS